MRFGGKWRKNGTAFQGDSGGPLAYKDSSNNWRLVGVVSFGASGQCSSKPKVAARVSHFVPWITEKIGQSNWNFYFQFCCVLWIDEFCLFDFKNLKRNTPYLQIFGDMYDVFLLQNNSSLLLLNNQHILTCVLFNRNGIMSTWNNHV